VEVICRKYLELRYRLLPYLYSMVYESTKTGLPVMRALWLHFPNDASAVSCGDEYLWGRSFLVAPVVEKGAANRRVYLPQGEWYDFWSEQRTTGGREIIRNIDLETMPLYVRAGSIVPMGPVKQFTSEKSDAPLTLSIYPGADASFLLYEDDGASFNYRNGEWMGIEMRWNESRQTLRLELASESRMLSPAPRDIEVRLKGKTQMVKFTGKPIEISF
jgi:alpha-glucosidase (family GH31 glycosyl hydrolase)